MNSDSPAQAQSAPGLDETIQALMASGAGAHDPLVRARDFYLTLFEEFPALIWRAGLDAKCNYFNKTWLAFTGKSLEQELGDGWVAGVHPDDMAQCVSTYLDCFAHRRAFQMEYRLRHFDGEYRWLADFGRPFFDLDGEFAGYIGSCYDITDRKNDEQALRESEERYRQLIEHMPDTIFILQDERIVYINRSGLRFFGAAGAEEILERAYTELVLPEHHPYIRAMIASLHSSGKDYLRFEAQYQRPGRPDVFVEVTGTPITYNNQPAEQVIVRDITERRQAETIMHDLAYRDSLTQLFNRKAFQEDLERRIRLAESGGKLAIFFIDLDNFKTVNDCYGHDIGDVVLIEVARRLQHEVRGEDTLARLGGDEFILLSEVSNRADAAIIIERLQKAFIAPIEHQGLSIPVSMSIGISMYPDDDSTPEQLVQKADYAMYQIKNGGKDGYGFYQSP